MINYKNKKMVMNNKNELAVSSLEKKLLNDKNATNILNCCKVLGSNELKLAFLFEYIFNIDTANISKLLSVDKSAMPIVLGKTKEILSVEISFLDIENLKNLDNEIGVLTELFYDLFNKINYSCDIEQGVKKFFILKTVRLFEQFAEVRFVNKHVIHAFLAYLYFNLSRQDTIFSKEGEIISLREQDRSKWDVELIKKGLFHLSKSADGKNVTIYHLESAISAVHCLAKSYKQTDWNKILSLYNNYLSINESPYVELQRAGVISKVRGAREGIESIKSIRNLNELIDNHLLYSTLGNLNLQIHNYNQALKNYEKAYEYSDIDIDKEFYGEKVKICRQRLKMISRYQFHNSF